MSGGTNSHRNQANSCRRLIICEPHASLHPAGSWQAFRSVITATSIICRTTAKVRSRLNIFSNGFQSRITGWSLIGMGARTRPTAGSSPTPSASEPFRGSTASRPENVDLLPRQYVSRRWRIPLIRQYAKASHRAILPCINPNESWIR